MRELQSVRCTNSKAGENRKSGTNDAKKKMRVTSIGEALSERENKRKSNNQQIWNILCRMHRMLANIYYCFEISLCEICRDSATDRTQKINRAQRRHIVVSLCAFCHLLGSLVNK